MTQHFMNLYMIVNNKSFQIILDFHAFIVTIILSSGFFEIYKKRE